MKPTNYFKVRVYETRVERTFAFEGWSRREVLVAFDRATLFAAQHGGRLSVCYPVTLVGPWSSAPVIVPPEVREEVDPPAFGAPRLALCGEGGCW